MILYCFEVSLHGVRRVEVISPNLSDEWHISSQDHGHGAQMGQLIEWRLTYESFGFKYRNSLV